MPESAKHQCFLCFDFGLKRIGVAVANDLICKAQALTPLRAKDGIPQWSVIETLVAEWSPDEFVVGLPLNMDGSENDMCARARKFAKRLQGRFNRPYNMMDERLSSYEAKGMVIAAGGNRDFGYNSVDGAAAQLILESWFASKGDNNG